jgi:hypothetical protein
MRTIDIEKKVNEFVERGKAYSNTTRWLIFQGDSEERNEEEE